MLLKHLYTGRKRSDLIVVKDNFEFNGLTVIKKFIEEANLRNIKVHLLLTEKNYLCNLKSSSSLVIHRYFPDPWNILPGREAELSFEQIVDCVLSEQAIVKGAQVLFVVCSLSSLLQFISFQTFCNAIKKLCSSKYDVPSGNQVLCLLHSELFLEESQEYKKMMYLASSILTLTKKAENNTGEIDLEHRQASGKITKEVYTCSLKAKKDLQFEIKKDKPVNKVAEDQEQTLVNTTFKLTLEDKEKELRNQVVLPYVKTSSSTSQGKIYYEPDEYDDWDDEDPDDDLEI